jgi:hypothetical protein
MPSSALFLLRSLALKRWVLACFVLAIGVAHASALIKPQAIELLCSTNGAVRLILQGSSAGDDQQAQLQSEHSTPCALCMPLFVPLPERTLALLPRADLSYNLRPIAAAPASTRALPALPARGPPGFRSLIAII